MQDFLLQSIVLLNRYFVRIERLAECIMIEIISVAMDEITSEYVSKLSCPRSDGMSCCKICSATA